MIEPISTGHASTPPTAGGRGGVLSELSHADLVRRALSEWWPIPSEVRNAIAERQIEIATNPNSSAREAAAAARVLATMSGQNVAIVRAILDKVSPDKHEHSVAAGGLIRQALAEIEGDERFERLAVEMAMEMANKK